MTQSQPVGGHLPGLFLIAAMLLLIAAAFGVVWQERERSLAASVRGLVAAANATEAYARLGIDVAMRRLEALAVAAADGAKRDAGLERLAEPVRLTLAGIPGARFAAVVDARRRLAAAAGEPDAAPAGAIADGALARLADPRAPDWYVGGYPGGSGSLLLGRRLTLPGGGFIGVAVVAIGADWLDSFAAAMDLGSGGDIVLLDAGRRVILRAPSNRIAAPGLGVGDFGATPSAKLLETRTVLPGLLELAVEGGREDLLAGWRQRSVAILAVLAGVLALLAAGWQRGRARIRGLQSAKLGLARQLGQLATAVEQLSRLRYVGEIAAGAEAIGRTLLSCERVAVTLGAPPEAPAGLAPEQRSLDLLSAGGERLGRMTVTRGDGRALDGEDDFLLEPFAVAVASALERATLLADTMRSKSELELILSTISEGIVVLDRGWCVRYANAAAARIMQCRREDMPGANVWALLPGVRDGDIGGRLQAASGEDRGVAFTGFCAPLNAWLEMRANPFAGGLTLYFRDVTNQLQTEEKLRQVQKLEAVGQLTGGIAHDVNNLLTVILGNLELLAMRAEDRLAGVAEAEEDRQLDLTMAEAGVRAGESASQLVHRLLSFSRRQPLAPQVVAVSELLRSLQPLLRGTMSEQVSVRMNWPAGLWHALLDPAELESAILNLSINAQDAMPGGGTLTIEASNIAVNSVYAAAAGLERTGDTIMISVSDTGTGMPREVAARAFDPFFTTKAPGKGTGLGLSMVYGFVRQSGGQVMIDSEPGRGTVVRMYLPRALPPEPAARPSARAGVTGGSETVLLVEDNDMVRAHTEAMLRGLGYDVVAAPDGPAALHLLAEGRRPALLLTDVILPGGMTGRDVAEAAQGRLPGLRVLFISGYSGDVLMENGRLPPGVDLLAKPFRRSELAARVRAQLEAGG